MSDLQAKRRQMADLPVPVFPTGTGTADLIAALPGAAQFAGLIEHFTDYPEKSFTFPPFRALLYAMIRALRPRWAVEIGSLFAGTSEIFASAITGNGEGRFTTIDPFGADRVPGIVATWPQPWQSCTDFRTINSMQLFMSLENQPERPDIVFIDGNHEYEYALFDLLNSARYLARGGVIILDNYYDHGVRQAGQKFEADNPAWKAVKFAAHPAFGTNFHALQLDGLYRIYVAPKVVSIGAQPRGQKRAIEADGIQGLDFTLAEPSPGGRLFYKVYLRTIPYDFHLGVGEMEEMAVSGEIDVAAGATEAHVALPVPLATLKPREGIHRRCEVNLLFESRVPGQPLLLTDEPALRLFER